MVRLSSLLTFHTNPKLIFSEVAGFKFGFPKTANRTNGESSISLTLPRRISEENIWAMEGAVKEVPIEPLNKKSLENEYLNENFGSNDDSLSSLS